jgi:pimeloyl-ACP methyl ester carboxylesterase
MKTTKSQIAIYREEIKSFTGSAHIGNGSSLTPQEKICILFIHGFPYDHHMWDNQVIELKQYFNCITYDIRGLGASPPGEGQFTLESFVDDVEEIIYELKLHKPVLCGLSMGGYITLRTVERMESKLGGLILCDTKSEADANEGKLKRAESIKKINSEGLQSFINGFVPGCFSDTSVINKTKEYIEVLYRSLNSNPAGVKGCILAMQGRTDTTSYLQHIRIPTLVICGEEDKLTPPELMKKMADKIKNSEFVIVPNAGHMSPIENPDFFNNALLNFLNKYFK